MDAQPDRLADRDGGVGLDIGGLEVTERELDLGEPLVRGRERDPVAEPGGDLLGIGQILHRLAHRGPSRP